MKHYLLLTLLAAMICTGNLFAQGKRYKLVQEGKGVKVIEDQPVNSNLRTSAHDITVNITPNTARPESAIDIHIYFAPSVNIESVGHMVLTAKPACTVVNCNDPSITSSYLSSKIINKTARTVDFTIGGLLPFKEYLFWGAIFGLDGDRCTGSDLAWIPFKTAPAPAPKPEKMLVIINKEFEGNARLNAALDTYEDDIAASNPMLTIEKYYIQDDNLQKGTLYLDIRRKFKDENLTYLFFLGGNAALTGYRVMLDNNGQPVNAFVQFTFSYYAHPLYTTFEYYAGEDRFKLFDRQDFCATPPTEVRPEVFQQQNAMVSMGMVLPDVNFNTEQKIDYLVNYFNKVHAFRSGDISFEKKVLITDGFVSEQEVVDLAETNGAWTSAEVLQYGRTKDPDYSGEDPVWKNDFINKLGNRSYEIFSLTLHGTWNYHSFGIYNQDIANLPQLNTRLIDLYSCSVGAFNGPDYLAGRYLGKGNVLNVHAFSENLGVFTETGKSGLKQLYNEGGPYKYLSQGFNISNSYRYAHSYQESELILGDPLLKLRAESSLPVTLEVFNAQKQETQSWLTWTTSEEINSDCFDIQHSSTGKQWEKIGTVMTNGSKPGSHSYEFIHHSPVPGQNLYRLKMIDTDGTFSYSKIENVSFPSEKLMSIFPNPVADKLYLPASKLPNVKSVSILNSLGQSIRKFTNISSDGLNLTGLQTGIYMVRVEMTNGKMVTEKIIKSK
ncbi:MAG: T9SS type A sorting domain-containing protein [Dyadobacter sp.]|uniref:T9SS type A sorting domain-containing protein n=1 Tax=Dyadobacter sp. TaxID=1914288 RepID=UPI0032641FEF